MTFLISQTKQRPGAFPGPLFGLLLPASGSVTVGDACMKNIVSGMDGVCDVAAIMGNSDTTRW